MKIVFADKHFFSVGLNNWNTKKKYLQSIHFETCFQEIQHYILKWSVVAYCDRNLCLKLKSQVINQPDDYKREKNCRKTDSKKPDIE